MKEFEAIQPIAYKILNNSLNGNKVSNAYLIEDNNTKQGYELACSFCECLIGTKIELSANAMIIRPEGQWIKREQIDEIKKNFSTKAIIGEYKVYIITNAEKLNQSAGNALLKFLEEPEEKIVAILITDNINQVLETIKSRSVIIPLICKSNSVNLIENITSKIALPIDYEVTKEKIDDVINFVEYVDKNKIKTLLHIKKIFKCLDFEKINVEFLFNTILLFYKEILEYKTLQKTNIFGDYISSIKNISNSNTLEEIIDKSKIVIEIIDDLKYNANIQMIFDKFLIRMEEI